MLKRFKLVAFIKSAEFSVLETDFYLKEVCSTDHLKQYIYPGIVMLDHCHYFHRTKASDYSSQQYHCQLCNHW